MQIIVNNQVIRDFCPDQARTYGLLDSYAALIISLTEAGFKVTVK